MKNSTFSLCLAFGFCMMVVVRDIRLTTDDETLLDSLLPDQNVAIDLSLGILNIEISMNILKGFDDAYKKAEHIAENGRTALLHPEYRGIAESDSVPFTYLEQANGELHDLGSMTGYVVKRINGGDIEVHVGVILDPQNSAEENYEQVRIVRKAARDVVLQHQIETGAYFNNFFALQPTGELEPGTIVHFMGDQNGVFSDNLDAFGYDLSQGKHVFTRAQLADRANTPDVPPKFNGAPIPIL